MDARSEYLDLIRCTLSLLNEEKRSYLLFDRKAPLKPKEAAPIDKPVAPVVIKREEPVLPPPQPKPAPPPLLKKEEPAPAPAKPAMDFEDLKKLLHAIMPELSLSAKIPSDVEAKKIAQRYLYKHQAEGIVILIHQEPAKEKLFLENLANALSSLYPSKIALMETIEKNDEWETFLSSPTLKIIIACDYSIWEQKNLMKHYKEIPAKSETFLGNVPLFMLPSLSLYFKEPLLKRSLWKALCQKLGLPQSS
jgi:hypothetical protein